MTRTTADTDEPRHRRLPGAARDWLRFGVLPLAMVIAGSVSSQADVFAAGGSIANGGNYTGTVVRGQVDEWTFSANKGDAMVLTASEVGSNTPFYPYLQVQAPDGKNVSYPTGDLEARVDFRAPQSGT